MSEGGVLGGRDNFFGDVGLALHAWAQDPFAEFQDPWGGD